MEGSLVRDDVFHVIFMKKVSYQSMSTVGRNNRKGDKQPRVAEEKVRDRFEKPDVFQNSNVGQDAP